jgi:pimeloyl-ACP methyl ester carboxylesterase
VALVGGERTLQNARRWSSSPASSPPTTASCCCGAGCGSSDTGPHTAGFVLNVDCADRAVERVERLCEAVNAATGRRVAIVGHSRGGHLARAAAARRPDLVSHAISIGADLQGLLGVSSPTRLAAGLVRRGLQISCAAVTWTASERDAGAALPATTRRRSRKGDGVVRWGRAIVDEAVAEALALPEL